MSENRHNSNFFLVGLLAMFLLGVFVLLNFYLSYRDSHKKTDPFIVEEREKLPSSLEGKGKRLAFHDFEAGNASDMASHLAHGGHGGRQSLKLSSKVPFSPGLWIKFKDLNPGDSTWISATGYVWFSCPDSLVKCSLVATCNHQGTNFKYQFIALEKENLQPGKWNRVSLDYRIPPAPDGEDVLQVYFWCRGAEEMLVDDIRVDVFAP
jgi:hypothetical protein